MFSYARNVNIDRSTFTDVQGDFNYTHRITVQGNLSIGNDSEDARTSAMCNATSSGAAYDSEERVPPPRCYPGTRLELLSRIMDLTDGAHGPKSRIIWLHGPAGSGKSAVAQTVAEKCADLGYLAASFFFSRALIPLLGGKEAVAPVATVTPTYLDHARDLADTLHEIYSYTKSQSSRNKLIRMIRYKSDAGTIQEYRDRLKQSLDVFTLKSTMSIQDTLAEIKEQVSNMADQTKDLHEREVRRQESLEMEAQEREAKKALLEREKASEKAKLELELEQRRLDKEKADRERADRERAELERVARLRAEREQAELERAERERIERERAENARADREREEARLAQGRLEAERVRAAQDRLDQERIYAHPQSQGLGPQPTTPLNPFRPLNPFSESPHAPYSSPHSPISAPQPTPLPGLQNPTLPGLQSLPGFHSTPGLHSTLPGLQYMHPGLYSPHGGYTSVGGDQNTYSNSVVNTNSGNTSNNIVTNSNNDSSVRTYQVGRRWK